MQMVVRGGIGEILGPVKTRFRIPIPLLLPLDLIGTVVDEACLPFHHRGKACHKSTRKVPLELWDAKKSMGILVDRTMKDRL